MGRAWLPPLLLALYACAFAQMALGGGLLVFDDHPGQLYRLWHALTVGVAPWRFNPGWWAGYAELQFYPPGFSYAGAALHYAAFGALDPPATYRLLLWVTYLLPGMSTYALLARALKDPWIALPGAFLALTLSGGSRSGVEEGMRWGLVAARLGWGVLPLLGLRLLRWHSPSPAPLGAAALLAAIILIHPAHAPAGVALVFLAAWHASRSRVARLGQAALLLAAAPALASFWLLPLMTHLSMALPLAWGEPSPAHIARSIAERPLLVSLAAAAALAWWIPKRRGGPALPGRWLADFAPLIAGMIVLDMVVAQPLGMMWLPADRLLDSFFLALILAASLGLALVHESIPRLPTWWLAAASIGFCALISSWSLAEPTLSLWPRSGVNEWPKYETVGRGLRLPELRTAVRQAPPGRILFIRSAIPLDYRPEWRRPHSHLTALTPLEAGREIINGTFTHPSPIAGLLYTGSATNRPITSLVEQRDGAMLFGRPLAELDARAFNELADRLRVSAVVALDEDQDRLDFVSENPAFSRPSRIGPFLLFTGREARPTPSPSGAQRWQLAIGAHSGGWVSTGIAYSPLWQSRAGGERLPVRRGELGLLEVKAPAGPTVVIELSHVPGAAEWAGTALSAASALALAIAWHRRRRAATGLEACGRKARAT